MPQAHELANLGAMGHDSHPHGHGHGHQHQHEHQGEDMVEMLELDAAVMGTYLDTATDRIRAALGREPVSYTHLTLPTIYSV